MNSEYVINSIYNPKKKPKDSFVFPKINKAEVTPPQNKIFARGASRKYNQQNIFKIQDEKKQKVKLRIEEDRLRQIKNKQYEQLQAKMAEMMRKHQEQMRQIEEREKQINAQIQFAKKDQYQIKLNLWEYKNQIMQLNSLFLEEENQYKRLYNEIGYQEDDDIEEAENQQRVENGSLEDQFEEQLNNSETNGKQKQNEMQNPQKDNRINVEEQEYQLQSNMHLPNQNDRIL